MPGKLFAPHPSWRVEPSVNVKVIKMNAIIAMSSIFIVMLFPVLTELAALDDTISNTASGDDMYISSPGYPKTLNEPGTCEISIDTDPFENRQIRLDFVAFDMLTPTNKKTAICDQDKLIISSGSSMGSYSDLTVCGPFSNEHLYYGLDDDSNVVNIKFITSGSDYGRLWKIKFSKRQYSDDNPNGCDQFYPRTSEIMTMMNPSRNGHIKEHKDNDLVICIRIAKNICAIIFEPCDPTKEPFRVLQLLKHTVATTLIKLGPWIHKGIPKDVQGGCIRYQQQYCSHIYK